MSFSDVVEAVKELTAEEKQSLQLLLKQYLREERREDIYQNFQAAQLEQKNGELKFSSDLNELKQLLEE
jgi:hypothetical protein